MARRTHVPKFGNWDANDHMPYTAVFDNARTGRGKAINPNDPSDSPGGAPGRRIFNPNDPEEMDASDLLPERPGPGNRDTGNSRGQPTRTGQEPPARRQVAAIPSHGSYPEGRGNPMPTRAPPTENNRRQGNRDRENIGTDRHADSPSTSFSADQSPSHPIGNPVKKSTAGMMGGASPAWDNSRRKSTGEEGQTFAPATPTRSRLRTGNSKPSAEDNSQKGAAALPKFGAWNAQDPGSGDGFTVIFNNARNERKAGGPVRIPQPSDNSQDSDLYNQQNVLKHRDVNRRWFCCFSPVVNA